MGAVTIRTPPEVDPTAVFCLDQRMTGADSTFHVDLRGVVDLLSHHLYSSPRVYLRELLQNAVDAITARAEEEPDAPRRVRVVPADVSRDGCLHVEDTGIGVAPEKQRLIFEAFQQADAGTSRKYGGTGLGLAIVKQVAERHGGSVAAAPAPGGGLAVTLTLPGARPIQAA